MNYNTKWRHANPEKARAHAAVQNAVRRNKIIKQPCEVCGNIVVHAHHDDYSHPLQIRWLCKKHHYDVHFGEDRPNKIKGQRKPTRLPEHKVYQPLRPNALIPLAKELRKENKTYDEIAAQLGYSKSQVYKWINDLHV